MDTDNSMQDASGQGRAVPVSVAVRLRQRAHSKKNKKEKPPCVECSPDAATIISTGDAIARSSFTFDYAFNPETITQDIFQACVQPLVEACVKDNIHSALLLHGPGRIKRELAGPDGLAALAIGAVMQSVSVGLISSTWSSSPSSSSSSRSVRASAVRVAGQEMSDLVSGGGLDGDGAAIAPRPNVPAVNWPEGAEDVVVKEANELMVLFDRALALRKEKDTKEDKSSSALLLITVQVSNDAGTRVGTLLIADLARSDSEPDSHDNNMAAFKDVIKHLSATRKATTAPPYASSPLTLLLSHALGGPCRTLVLLHANAAAKAQADTMELLRFCTRVKQVMNYPTVNEIAKQLTVLRRLVKVPAPGALVPCPICTEPLDEQGDARCPSCRAPYGLQPTFNVDASDVAERANLVPERILDSHHQQGVTYYLLKWRGLSDAASTWEPEAAVRGGTDASTLIAQYEAARAAMVLQQTGKKAPPSLYNSAINNNNNPHNNHPSAVWYPPELAAVSAINPHTLPPQAFHHGPIWRQPGAPPSAISVSVLPPAPSIHNQHYPNNTNTHAAHALRVQATSGWSNIAPPNPNMYQTSIIGGTIHKVDAYGGVGGGGGGPGGSRVKVDDIDDGDEEGGNARILTVKRAMPASLTAPYRISLMLRLAALIGFLYWRISNPNPAAYALWGISSACSQPLLPSAQLISPLPCQVWFGMAWLLDQAPKLSPVYRVTYTDRLPRDASLLPAVDIVITTADPSKEPPITTANTVLSCMAMRYPAGKLAIYVTDDAASKWVFDTIAETVRFARVWVPFAHRYNVEPRAPEMYFSNVKGVRRGAPSSPRARAEQDSARRLVHAAYDKFKSRVAALGELANAADNNDSDYYQGWPGRDRRDHDPIVQVFHHPGEDEDKDCVLPYVVYIAREKRLGFMHHKKAGSANAAVRASALITNGQFLMNLDCDHYVHNSDALREAMCILLDPVVGDSIGYVQFPQRFDAIDRSDRYANHNIVFYEAGMKGLDGVQGPFYIGTGCVFRRKALYGATPDHLPKSRDCLCCCCFGGGRRRKEEEERAKARKNEAAAHAADAHVLAADHLAIVLASRTRANNNSNFNQATRVPSTTAKRLGLLPSLVRSVAQVEGSALPKPSKRRSTLAPIPPQSPRTVLTDVATAIACDYEDQSEWGKEIGWLYGSVTEDVVTGYLLHSRGWRSAYCNPSRPAFKGTAPINLADRLHQLLRWATGSVEIFFSRRNALLCGGGSRLKLAQRLAYINVCVYPFTGIILLLYTLLPPVCLMANRFIMPAVNLEAVIFYLCFFLTVFASALLELRWSGVSIDAWWRTEQFWIIAGISAHVAGFALALTLTQCEFVDLYTRTDVTLAHMHNLTLTVSRYAKLELHHTYAQHTDTLTLSTMVPSPGVIQGVMKAVAGVDIEFRLTAKGNEHDDDDFDSTNPRENSAELYKFRFTWLIVVPVTVMLLNILGIVAGFATAITGGNWAELAGKVIFSLWVLIHMYPFAKVSRAFWQRDVSHARQHYQNDSLLQGLMGKRSRPPTIVIIWSLLITVVFAGAWVLVFRRND
eukprot:jgi/Chlat1/9023/Chrsp94S08346